jgi:hypothetical protein
VPYEKNKYRRDTIARFGQETGLPLFADLTHDLTPALSSKEREKFKSAPKAMYVARETRKNAHTLVTFDKVSLGDKQQRVYDVLLKIANPENYEVEEHFHVAEKLLSLSNEEIAKFLDVAINHVVGRTFELREYGLVTFEKKRACMVTGNVVSTWRITTDEEQLKIKSAK